jgi:hypothetical protein
VVEGCAMNAFYLVLGVVLLVLAVIDLVWTTLWVDGGAGPLSSRLSTQIWRGLRSLGGRRSRTLSLAGPFVLLATLFLWVALIWVGWTFLYAGDSASIHSNSSGEPATWSGRVWYVAYTMFTVGNGDFIPSRGVWQIASSVTAASGMLFVTMGVSYVISILGAVSTKRAFAGSVTALGRRGEQMVEAGWDGTSLHSLDLPLNALTSQLGLLVEQHRSYPVLHYYHSEGPGDAAAVAVAVLDEALTLIRFGVSGSARLDPALLKSAQSGVGSYLSTLNSAFIEPSDHLPPPPDLGRLRDAGIPTVSDEDFAAALAGLEERRRKLLGMIDADAWEWPPVEEASER